MTIRNDFPDYGQAPTFLTHNPDNYPVISPGVEIRRFDCSSYQYGVLYVGTGIGAVDNDLSLDWLGAVGGEGDIVTSSRFCRLDGGVVALPFQVLTPTLRLRDEDSSTYPYSLSVACTLFTSPPYQHLFPGGGLTINESVSISMGGSALLFPSGCGPGEHWLSVGTDSTDWSATVTIFPRRGDGIPIPFVTSGSGSLTNASIMLPATQWILGVANDDADAGFTVAMFRTPNPN